VKAETHEQSSARRRPRAKAQPVVTQNVPQQARSRATLGRLLDATEQLLEEGGLDAATIPAIAERAGVSVGLVYRRFPDKDNLLRAVYERFFARSRDGNLAALTTIARVQMPLKVILPRLIHGMIEGYKRKRNILRALIHYARTHRDERFRRAALEMNRDTMKALSVVLLSLSGEIHHPHPQQAIDMAMLAIGSLLHATILEEEPIHGIKTPDFENELTRMVFAYLGIEVAGRGSQVAG
jgi:AcrR family transcriptional regulator